MKVLLLGDLGDKYGKEWNMGVKYLRDVFQLIACQRPGFKQDLEERVRNGLNFTIQRGEKFISESELELSFGKEDLVITPVPAGASGAVGKILAGVALIALSFFNPGFAGLYLSQTGVALTAALGINLALTGIQELLVPGPEVDADTPDSYLFNGPVNTVKEGLPVPVLYGEMIIGGAPINVSFTTKKPASTGYMYSQLTGNNSIVAVPAVLGGI